MNWSPEKRARVKEKWHLFIRAKYIDNLIAITYEPNPMWYALEGKPCPPLTRYCINSWTEKK